MQDDSKNVSLKIGSKVPQKLGPFFSLFLIRLTLSSGQKWFLRPYFPLIRGTFLLKSGLRFSFWALEVPEPRVRKRHLHFQNWLSTPYNIPPSPPIYCLHLWTSFIQKFRKNQYHRLIVLSESFLSSYSSRERDVSMEVCA